MQGCAYINSEFVAPENARISIFDWGFLHSDATYDVAHVWQGKFFRLGDHLDRFFASMDRLRLNPGKTKQEVRAVAHECVRRAGLRDAYVEVLCTRGLPQPGSRDPRTCTNHFIYMADGFGLRKGFVVGNGSSGSIVDCHANWTYWIDNYDSQSRLSQSDESSVKDFIEHNTEAYILGDCSELLVKDFWIFTRVFTRFISQNGRGPSATCFAHMGDVTVEGFRFETTAPCDVNLINPTLAILADYDDLTNATVGVSSTGDFQGRARFFNSALFARPDWDFIIGGGDIGFDLIHMFDHSINGARVDGGTLHLINKSSWIAYDQTFPVYQIYFGGGAGTAGNNSMLVTPTIVGAKRNRVSALGPTARIVSWHSRLASYTKMRPISRSIAFAI